MEENECSRAGIGRAHETILHLLSVKLKNDDETELAELNEWKKRSVTTKTKKGEVLEKEHPCKETMYLNIENVEDRLHSYFFLESSSVEFYTGHSMGRSSTTYRMDRSHLMYTEKMYIMQN